MKPERHEDPPDPSKRPDGGDGPNAHRMFDRAMLDTIRDVLFAFTADGRIVRWNEWVNEVTGYSDEEIAAMHPLDFVPEEERAFVARKIRDVVTEGKAQLEAHYLTKGGRAIPYEFTGSLLEEEGEQLICGVGRDISERVDQAEQLRRSEQRYRRLFEDSQEGIAITTPTGDILEANDAICQLSGYSREELLQMHVSDLYADTEDRGMIVRRLEEEGKVRNVVVGARRRNGEIIRCQISSTASFNADGDIEAIQSFIRDVTEEKKAQEALRESEEKFRTLAERSLVGIYLMQDGVFQYVNPSYAEMLERSPEELIGTDPFTVLHPGEHDRARAKVDRRYSGESDEGRGVYRMITKHDKTVWVDINGVRMTFRGHPAIIGTAYDITERRRMQREILRIQEEERQRIAQDLHDGVCSALTGTMMILRALANEAHTKYPELATELEQVTGIVRENTQDVRRIARGMNPVNLDREGLIGGLQRLVEHRRGGPEITLDFEGTPALTNEVATHLYWIAQEAVTNARKYAQSDRIRVHLISDEAALSLTIEDDGIGFEPGRVERDGMGMRSMQYRTELLGGTLTITSSPGSGTSVRCRLPLDIDPTHRW